MMADSQQQSGELSRSHSLPILNREEAVLKKLQDHDGIISLMQTQIEFQSELIAKHDKTFEALLSQVQELSSKVKNLEESFSQKSEEAARSALWTTNSSTKTGGTSPGKTQGGNKISSIADMVKETAEQALGLVGGEDETQVQSGFVFDEKLGLYFDHSSGYYYDPVKQLYYNGHTKTFYSYDATTNTYQVHNSAASGDSLKRKKKKSKVKKQTKHKKVSDQTEQSEAAVASPQSPAKDDDALPPEDENLSSPQASSQKSPESPPSDMEEGEITTSAESSPNRNECTNSSDDNESSSGENSEEDPQQNNFPPCIRAVVQESPKSVKSLKKGTLFLVPYTGGSIGSRGSQHALLLPCPSVEKNHAQICYYSSDNSSSTLDTDQQNGGSGQGGKYFITDLGSTHGTYLNRARLSECGVKSEPQELVHGSMLQVGEDVTLLIHIHPGDFTCGHCEPGLILQKEPLYEYTGNTGETARRSEMKKLKKKYGLDRKNVNVGVGVDTAEEETGGGKAKYVDRAKNRRVKLGSDNPFAKTEVASTATPIKQSNKGFKMLQKMGWKGGEGLGKSENQGIVEPIDSGEVKVDRLGLGVAPSSSTGIPPPIPLSKFKPSKRMENLSKTVERFNEAKKLDAEPASPDF